MLTYYEKQKLVKAESKRIIQDFKRLKEPNSPDGNLFAVEISPDFLNRTTFKEIDKVSTEIVCNYHVPVTKCVIEGMEGIYFWIEKEDFVRSNLFYENYEKQNQQKLSERLDAASQKISTVKRKEPPAERQQQER